MLFYQIIRSIKLNLTLFQLSIHIIILNGVYKDPGRQKIISYIVQPKILKKY